MLAAPTMFTLIFCSVSSSFNFKSVRAHPQLCDCLRRIMRALYARSDRVLAVAGLSFVNPATQSKS